MAHKFTNLDNERVIWYHIDKHFVRKSVMPKAQYFEISLQGNKSVQGLISNAFVSPEMDDGFIVKYNAGDMKPYEIHMPDRLDDANGIISNDHDSITNIQNLLSVLNQYQEGSDYSFSPHLFLVNERNTYNILGAVRSSSELDNNAITGIIVNDQDEKGLALLKLGLNKSNDWTIEAYAYSHKGTIGRISKEFIDKIII